MQNIKPFVCGAMLILASAGIAKSQDQFKPFHADYMIYSGESVRENAAPTAADRKLSILVEGKPAKDIFNSIGPDHKYTCGAENGARDRSKGGVQCTYNKLGAGKGYRCWIGVDLRTGKSIPTVSC